jgi:hypothetical protein
MEPTPPWAAVVEKYGGVPDDLSLALPSISEALREELGSSFTGVWVQLEAEGRLQVATSVIGGSEVAETAERVIEEQLADASISSEQVSETPFLRTFASGLPPSTAAKLQESMAGWADSVLSGDSANFLVGASYRPDLAGVQVDMTTLDPQTIAFLEKLAPLCSLVFTEVGGRPDKAVIGRQDMPPYKAGKIEHVKVGSEYSNCTTGYVFELNGTGQDRLYISTVGHCSHKTTTLRTCSTVQVWSSSLGEQCSPTFFALRAPPMATLSSGTAWVSGPITRTRSL